MVKKIKLIVGFLMMIVILSCSEQDCKCLPDTTTVSNKGNGNVIVCHDGKDKSFNENAINEDVSIKDDKHGKTHLDGTTCQVGSCTTLAIDEYEYDPCPNGIMVCD